jgi:hypothetical protein
MSPVFVHLSTLDIADIGNGGCGVREFKIKTENDHTEPELNEVEIFECSTPRKPQRMRERPMGNRIKIKNAYYLFCFGLIKIQVQHKN